MQTWAHFHRAAKQRILLSNIKQTTSQNAYILYEHLAGSQRNSAKQILLVSNCIC